MGSQEPSSVTLSPLDEQRFGVRTAKCADIRAEQLPEVLEYCHTEQVQLLIVRCSATSGTRVAQALEENGFLLMDTSVHFVRSLVQGELPDISSDLAIRPFRLEDEESVRKIAEIAFAGYTDHYHMDLKLDPKRSDEVYVDWSLRGCKSAAPGSAASVCEIDGGVVGYVTARLRSETDGECTLSGVLPEARGKGVYRALMTWGMHWARSQGAERMNFVTQIGNIAVQRVWVGLGFEPFDAFYTFHKWFEQYA